MKQLHYPPSYYTVPRATLSTIRDQPKEVGKRMVGTVAANKKKFVVHFRVGCFRISKGPLKMDKFKIIHIPKTHKLKKLHSSILCPTPWPFYFLANLMRRPL